MKPIWYFVGLILTVMGVLIMLTGIYSFINEEIQATVLGDLHPNIWWGALMIVVGIIYVIKNKNITIN